LFVLSSAKAFGSLAIIGAAVAAALCAWQRHRILLTIAVIEVRSASIGMCTSHSACAGGIMRPALQPDPDARDFCASGGGRVGIFTLVRRSAMSDICHL
jgi:hypothetical protein